MKTPPTLSVMYVEENGRYLLMRGAILIADCGQGAFAKSEAERIVRAVNCHEELLQAVKDLLSRGAHGDEWRTASEKRAMDAIHKAGQK